MFGLGGQEIIILSTLLLIIFGAKRLPDIMRSLGQALRELKKLPEELQKIEEDTKDGLE